MAEVKFFRSSFLATEVVSGVAFFTGRNLSQRPDFATVQWKISNGGI
jgi:hypothetical protein